MDLVLIEDHIVIRQMMAHVVDTLPEFRLVGEAADLEAGRNLCLEKRPDLVVLDLTLGGGSGIELLRSLRDAQLTFRCLVFSGFISPLLVQRAYELGATGFAEKSGTLEELIDALKTVASGGVYFGREITDAIRKSGSRAAHEPQAESLTGREREVLRFIAQGLSNKQMASALGVSVHTVENHRANLIRKTGIQPPGQLALLAIQLGLIEPDSTSGH